jgi:DNA-binding PadR family transcriptional regulator
MSWRTTAGYPSRGRPDKKVFSVTNAGRSELARWIAERLSGRGSSVTDSRTRELAVEIRGAAHGDLDALRTQVEALRRERAELLDTSLSLAKRQFPEPAALHDADLHRYLVLRGGIRAEAGSVDWLDEVLGALGGHRDRTISASAGPAGSRFHDAPQPRDHGLDAHRA